MAESHKFFENNPKIIFYKLLGTGAGDGFLWPDFSTYSILILWKKEEFANEFISKVITLKLLKKKHIQDMIISCNQSKHMDCGTVSILLKIV